MQRFDAIRCDLRGFGESPLPAEPYGDADDVHHLLDTLDIERAAIVGSSFGGLITLELASRWRERVERLVLLCPAWTGIDPDAELQRFAAEEERRIEAGDVEGAVELNVETWLGPEASADAQGRVRTMQRRAYELQLATPEDAASKDPEANPARVEAPTVVISGAHDLHHFREVATTLTEHIEGARHEELAWAGHLPSMERPDEMNQRLIDYLVE